MAVDDFDHDGIARLSVVEPSALIQPIPARALDWAQRLQSCSFVLTNDSIWDQTSQGIYSHRTIASDTSHYLPSLNSALWSLVFFKLVIGAEPTTSQILAVEAVLSKEKQQSKVHGLR
jgi:hypothetical protein